MKAHIGNNGAKVVTFDVEMSNDILVSSIAATPITVKPTEVIVEPFETVKSADDKEYFDVKFE